MQPNGAKTELFIFLLSEAEGLTSVWKYFKKSHTVRSSETIQLKEDTLFSK